LRYFENSKHIKSEPAERTKRWEEFSVFFTTMLAKRENESFSLLAYKRGELKRERALLNNLLGRARDRERVLKRQD